MANDADTGIKGLVDGVVSKIVTGYLWPLMTMALIGIGGWYLKDSNEVTRSHTHQLEVVMANQDRLADRVTAEIAALAKTFDLRDTNVKEELVRHGRTLEDHEIRLRGVERSQRLPSPN